MLKQLTYRKKNKLLIAIAIILFILSWKFAFKKTYDAFVLHQEFSVKAQDDNLLAFNPAYITEKSNILNKLLGKYTIDSAQWQNTFWLKASGAVSSADVKVIYQPEQKHVGDSTSALARQAISFEGNFKNLVLILDSLSKTTELGYLTAAQLRKVEQRSEELQMLQLKTTFSIIKSAR